MFNLPVDVTPACPVGCRGCGGVCVDLIVRASGTRKSGWDILPVQDVDHCRWGLGRECALCGVWCDVCSQYSRTL